MHAGLGDPVRVARHLRGREGAVHPAQVLAVDAVAGERAADHADDGHAPVAEPAVHVLAARRRLADVVFLPFVTPAAGHRRQTLILPVAAPRWGTCPGPVDWVDLDPAGTARRRSWEETRHDHRSHRRRRPHRRGQAKREASQLARRRPGVGDAQGPGRAQRAGPGPGGRRDHGLRHAGLGAVAQHRAQRRAGRGLARVRPRHHHRPPVRVVPAGDPLRGPGRDRRRLRRRGRGRGRVDDAHPDGLVGRARLRLSLRPAHDGPLHRRRGAQPAQGPGHRGRDDRRPVGHLPRRAGRLLRAQPPAGGAGNGRRPVRA